MAPLIKALMMYVGLSQAQVYGPLFIEAGEKFGLDPFLIAAVAYKETRLTPNKCYKGAHCIMQIQLKGRSCKSSMDEAIKRRLYDPRECIFAGAKMMSAWRKYYRKYHDGKPYHWLLHYNQGRGRCKRVNGKRQACENADRNVITTGKIGGYAQRVMGIYTSMIMKGFIG